MTEPSKDAGLIAVLIKRFEEQRLPVALDLKKKVDRGETLNDLDIAFLDEVFAGASELKPLLDRHSEYHKLVGQVMSLYQEITEKALQNQKNENMHFFKIVAGNQPVHRWSCCGPGIDQPRGDCR